MDAWSKAKNSDNKILILADSEASFTKEMGMSADASDNGLGMRSPSKTSKS